MKKVIVLLFLSVMILCNVFAGDLVKLTRWDEPMIWPDLEFAILGSGWEKFIGTLVMLELAINNTGEVIDTLELVVTWIDDTGFPLAEVNFIEVNVRTGVGIIKSMPFDRGLAETCGGNMELTVKIWRIQ